MDWYLAAGRQPLGPLVASVVVGARAGGTGSLLAPSRQVGSVGRGAGACGLAPRQQAGLDLGMAPGNWDIRKYAGRRYQCLDLRSRRHARRSP